MIQAFEPISVQAWQPNLTTKIIAFSLIPIVAALIAWGVFWSSKSNHYEPGKKTKQKIDSTLNELAKDPRVQTDIEKVQALYENANLEQ